MSTRPPRATVRYRDWMIEEALPFWATRGFDAAAGRFHERLGFDGRPLATPHRAMLQARQIATFAHAARLGWFPKGAALAEAAMRSLVRDFADARADGTGFAFSIDPASGRVASAKRDAYAHAFVLYAIGQLHQLNGDLKLLELADATQAGIERDLVDTGHGGLHDDDARAPGKKQNPHMHLLEAYLALEEAAPGRGWLDRAASLVGLFERRFRDSGTGALLEYFGDDWSADSRRFSVEPGHQFEWAWLLDRFEALGGRSTGDAADRLYEVGLRGVSAEGLILDELGPDLRPTKGSTRLWPHTEAIKAAAVRDPAFADRMADALLRRFLDRPFAGGWTDHFSVDGEPLVDGVPASSLYHLFLAAAEGGADPRTATA